MPGAPMPKLAETSACATTVLVVDDEEFLRQMMAEFLEMSGYRVMAAATADEAVAALRTTPVDVVFTDVRMPGAMDGIGLAQWVRCHRPTTRILMTSGFTTRAPQVVELSHAPLIAKPYRPEEVVRRVQELTTH
ncbi:MAG TPA: response regulator [Acetobacteraceae bacterium]|nr:response regulator [Acetobacteraceae bacterium]